MQKIKIVSLAKISIWTILSFILFLILVRYHSFLNLCAGICIFLFAMSLLQESFKSLSGGILNNILDKVANTNSKAFFFGFSLSTLVQSSGLVSILAISFLSAGLINLACGVAMIYGLNLSTALSAWIVGYFGLKSKLSLYALFLIVFGVIIYLNKHHKIKACGLFLLSLGFLFLGISYMKEGFENFKESVDISHYQMQGFLGLIVYVFIGIIITSLTQSSHATLTLAITALSVAQISYENALGIAIGANIGSTVMTIIGSLSSNIEGKKLTLTHILFNLIGAFLSIIFFQFYLFATEFLSLKFGISSDNYVLKLALFTTLFNVIAVLLLYPFIKQMCDFLNYFLHSNAKDEEVEKALYLNANALEFSDSAKEVLWLENKHLFENALAICAKMISVYPSDIYSKDDIQALIKTRNKPLEHNFQNLYQKKFKGLYSDIIEFAVYASSANKARALEFMDLRRTALFMATALKESKELQGNILKFAFSNNEAARAEYDHLRRNILRMLRLVQKLIECEDKENQEQIIKELEFNVKKYDAISSSSLDSLIRYKRISDSLATSIMNDTALARSIAKDFTHAASILAHLNA